jgi:hypothetical protein
LKKPSLISSLVKSVRSEARRLLMSGFSAFAGPLPIPASVIAIEARIIKIGLRNIIGFTTRETAAPSRGVTAIAIRLELRLANFVPSAAHCARLQLRALDALADAANISAAAYIFWMGGSYTLYLFHIEWILDRSIWNSGRDAGAV